MKEPTTPFAIQAQQSIQINRKFLESKGWVLKEEKPLYDSFVHSKNSALVCSIGLYGEFYIAELHWCNKTPEKVFSTVNRYLTMGDYDAVLKLLNIQS